MDGASIQCTCDTDEMSTILLSRYFSRIFSPWYSYTFLLTSTVSFFDSIILFIQRRTYSILYRHFSTIPFSNANFYRTYIWTHIGILRFYHITQHLLP